MIAEGSQRVLCIEDNPINWRLVQRLLSQAGFEAHWAEDGMRGFEMALELKPDLVLLDINLPGLSGFETATKFRQHAELRATTIVALTAKTLKSDRETALVAGCDGFIPKPIDPFAFVNQVRGYLGGQRESVDSRREGPILRNLSAQMVEHLEAQLRAAQESNQKLLETQRDLEERTRSLGRLVTLSQGLLTEHDPGNLSRRMLEQVHAELKAQRLHTYWSHRSLAYLEGGRWDGSVLQGCPILKSDHPFHRRARTLEPGVPLETGQLRMSRLWEEGVSLGFWAQGEEACLIPLEEGRGQEGRWGFWCLSRSEPFIPRDLEMLALYASLAQVSRENTELIASLTESSRALAASYEGMERAFQDLHLAKAALSKQEKAVLMEGLFRKIVQRLQSPVAGLWEHGKGLALLLTPPSPEQALHMEVLAESVRQIDHLLKALARRVDLDDPGKPEILIPQDIFYQELELLTADGTIPAGVRVNIDDRGGRAAMFGVYADFARIIQYMVQHAVGGPTPTGTLAFRAWVEEGTFHFALQDEGGPIPPMGLEAAFEPFSTLHQDAIMDIRSAGSNLPSVAQILTSYHGSVRICNEGDGTLLEVTMPLA
nr:response regulator [uncultured Holophaga sp.]